MKGVWVVGLWCCVSCLSVAETESRGTVFSGDFALVRESDWPGGQACDYVVSMDETVCQWGHLSVSVDTVMRSVLGSDVHRGGPLGPLLRQDSVVFAVRFGVIDSCTMYVVGNTVKPNGAGALAADTLQFAGYSLLGDTVRWVYTAKQVTRPKPCG